MKNFRSLLIKEIETPKVFFAFCDANIFHMSFFHKYIFPPWNITYVGVMWIGWFDTSIIHFLINWGAMLLRYAVNTLSIRFMHNAEYISERFERNWS